MCRRIHCFGHRDCDIQLTSAAISHHAGRARSQHARPARVPCQEVRGSGLLVAPQSELYPGPTGMHDWLKRGIRRSISAWGWIALFPEHGSRRERFDVEGDGRLRSQFKGNPYRPGGLLAAVVERGERHTVHNGQGTELTLRHPFPDRMYTLLVTS